MFKKVLLFTTLAILAVGFWLSPDFKEIAAGVAIFLFGMLALEKGFRSLTGGMLESLLRKTTDKLWKSLSFGIVSTTLMQSSSLVSIIAISFLSAGLITLTAGVGIVFGANLGTTTGAWLVAGFGLKVNIAAYAMPMLAFGIILVFQKSRATKGFGMILGGLGFLFLGIHHMKEGFDAFRETIDLTRFAVSGYPGVFLFALIGLLATVVMQSSHATLVLIITALAAKQITYENALALAIGANVGTTVTAILGAIGANVSGRRLAAAHLIFNLVTGLVAIGLIYKLTHVVDEISVWLGIGKEDYTLKLAVFHSLFNALGILIMLPLIKPMVYFLEKGIRRKVRSAAQPRYLHGAKFGLLDASIEAVRQETLHLYDNASDVIAKGLGLSLEEILGDGDLEEIVRRKRKPITIDIDESYNENVKGLYGDIVEFISRLQTEMTPEQSSELFSLRAAGHDIVEAIKGIKHLQKNLSHHVASSQGEIREEYEKLSLNLATVLRVLDGVRQRGDDSSAILSLDGLKLEMKQYDRDLSVRMGELIREDRISPSVTISLMNDSRYAYQVTKNLVEMGTVLFSTSERSVREAEMSVSLDESEVAEALANANPEPGSTTDEHP
ncbi:Na/Pi cotransporter family protein [Haloferula sp.]|uniref:Na/Pi cotransporter family protein n=1 Tax=Haloferula sp. TaxID=2497595 RepID=UPI003C72EEB7